MRCAESAPGQSRLKHPKSVTGFGLREKAGHASEAVARKRNSILVDLSQSVLERVLDPVGKVVSNYAVADPDMIDGDRDLKQSAKCLYPRCLC
jgi:hypothetical protein